MKRLALTLAIVACDPAAPTQTPPPAGSETQVPAQTPARNVDVRVEFEKTSDAYSSYIAAFLVIPAMEVHVQLFSVPFPYQCMRGETDAGDELVVECRGDDGYASAAVRLDHGHVIAVAHDYGRITAEKAVKDLALPPNATATIFAPPKFPEAH